MESRLARDALNDKLERLTGQLELERLDAVPPGGLLPTDAKGEVALNGQAFVDEKNTLKHRQFVSVLCCEAEDLPASDLDKVKLADPDDLKPDFALHCMLVVVVGSFFVFSATCGLSATCHIGGLAPASHYA